MKIGLDNAFGIHQQALSMRATRTSLLASNIANADTPGYKAQDIDFKQILSAQQDESASRIRSTHARHMQGGSVSSGEHQVMYRVPLMPSLDGNSVDTQLEQAEFARNNMEFLTSFRFLNGKVKGMMTAIKGE